MKPKRKAVLVVELAAANARIAELEQYVQLLLRRINHSDIETAQARVSRDSYRGKLELFLRRAKEQGITIQVVPPDSADAGMPTAPTTEGNGSS